MVQPSEVLIEVLFALTVFIVILELLTDYAEVVLALTVFVIIWQFVEVFGASLFLATFLLVTASLAYMLVYLALTAVGQDLTWTPMIAHLLDSLLTRNRAEQDRGDDGQNRGRLDMNVNTIKDYRR